MQRTAFAAGDIGDTLLIDVRRRVVLNTFPRARIETWMPNGNRILVSKIDADTGCRLLYIGSEDEERWKLLTPDKVSDGEPSFSPDGRKIATNSKAEKI